MTNRCAVEMDELEHDQRQSRAEIEQERHMSAAMDDLIYSIMDGQRYPKTGLPAIDLSDFLLETLNGSDLVGWLLKVVNAGKDEAAMVCYTISAQMENELRAYLTDSEFVRARATEMAREEE